MSYEYYVYFTVIFHQATFFSHDDTLFAIYFAAIFSCMHAGIVWYRLDPSLPDLFAMHVKKIRETARTGCG